MLERVTGVLTVSLIDEDAKRVEEAHQALVETLHDLDDLNLGTQRWSVHFVPDTQMPYDHDDVQENGMTDD